MGRESRVARERNEEPSCLLRLEIIMDYIKEEDYIKREEGDGDWAKGSMTIRDREKDYIKKEEDDNEMKAGTDVDWTMTVRKRCVPIPIKRLKRESSLRKELWRNAEYLCRTSTWKPWRSTFVLLAMVFVPRGRGD